MKGIELSADEARRLHLAAQGFGGPRTGGSLASVRKLGSRLGAYQIDSVNVLVRAHYMPAYSRLGPYDRDLIEKLAYDKRDFFEFWGHAACYLPMPSFPTFRWRMEIAETADWWTKRSAKARKVLDAVYAEVAERGPIGAGALGVGDKGRGGWWGWSEAKRAIEALFRVGKVAVAGRKNFARLYDLTERVIPADVLATPAPSKDDGTKQLLVAAAKAHGVGAASDLAGYFYLENWFDRAVVNGKRTRSQLPRYIAELVEEGRLVPTTIEGWTETAYTVPRAKVPSAMHTRALVSPFDPVLWNRIPTSRLFGFDYQIEIYVPEPKRVYGYYCLPFLLGDRLVGRIDLKADRKASTLRVRAAHAERGHDKDYVASELAEELRLMASWLGLEHITVEPKGDLARPLARAIKASPTRAAAGAKRKVPARRAVRT